MEVKITYDDIITRCEQLSAFEARGKVDAQGQSRFLDIHIGEVDTILIKQYITQARALLEERFERMILDTSEENEAETSTVTIVDKETRSPKSFSRYFDGFTTVESYDSLSSNEGVGYFVSTNRDSHPTFLLYHIEGASIHVAPTNMDEYDFPDGDMFYYIDTSTGNKYNHTGTHTSLGALVPYTPPTKTETVTKYVPYSFTWLIRTDTRWNGISTFTKHVNEAITSYVMAQWLSGRLDERVAFYDNLFNTSLTMAAKNIFTKTAP